MEEKKIMWVVLSISLFVLIVFGSALFLYSPSKFQSPNAPEDFAYIKEISDAPASTQKIDPDMWSRRGETVPGFIASDEENDEKKSITVIDGSDVEEGKKYIDVSPSNTEERERANTGKKLPEEVAKQLGAGEETRSEKKLEKDAESKGVAHSAEKTSVPSTSRDKAVQKTKEATDSGFAKRDGKRRSEESLRQDNQKIAERKENARSQPQKPSVQKSVIETVYWVQTASLSSRLNAEKARNKLAERHMKVQIFTKDKSNGLTHRVRVGPFSNKTEAEYWLKNIKDIQGFEQSYISEEKVKVVG